MIQVTPPPLSTQAMADLLCTLMLLCRGIDDDGQPFWAYMCIKPSMTKAFREAIDSGDVHLEEFGTIIESGPGSEVPPDIAQRMQRDYGVNHHYEDELLATAQSIAAEKVC